MSTKVKITTENSAKTIQTEYLGALFQQLHYHAPERDFLRTEIAQRLLAKKADLKEQPQHILDLSLGYPLHTEKTKNTHITYMQNYAEESEKPLPYPNGTFDAVLSNLTLPYIDDIPEHLIRLGRTCKKDGFILLSTLGSESFKELKTSFRTVEGEKTTPHFLPMPTLDQLGKLLLQLGFKLPVVDRDHITLLYPSVESLFTEMRHCGSKNLNTARHKGLYTPRQLNAVKKYYQQTYATTDGHIPLSLEIIYLYAHRPA